MKFSCRTQDFFQAVQLVNCAVSSQHALPILGNILIQTNSGSCSLSATDLEFSITTQIPATVESDGAITIPAKALLTVTQFSLGSDLLLESLEGTQLKCSTKKGKTVLSGERSTNFPTIPTVEQSHTFSVDASALLGALSLVTFSSAKTSLRPVLSGVLFQATDRQITLVATDSYRLSEYTIPTHTTSETSCIIPVKFLDELKMFLASYKPPRPTSTEGVSPEGPPGGVQVDIVVSEQQIGCIVGQATFTSRLIEGKFPDYKAIIPPHHTVSAVIGTEEFLTNIRRMHYFAKELNNTVTLAFSGDSLHMTTPETQFGKDEADIGIESGGGEAKIALSSSYLLDFLSRMTDGGVRIFVGDSTKPAIFRVPNHPHYLHLIMPLRMLESTAGQAKPH